MNEAQADNPMPQKVKFNYIKSNLFRVIHTDGVTADFNPNGDIAINLYSQRFSIPEEVIFDLSEEGKLVGEGVIIKKEGSNIDAEIIREIDILALMNLETAKELLNQLQEIVAEYED
jgi:hypothetical protein